ncbi:hypothetical protein BJX65DRAFT_320626 [Aspergillus insuetus]
MEHLHHNSIHREAWITQRSCTHCGRTFRRKEHLQRHLRTHTKEKPFACACGASFSRRDLLKRHGRIAHGEPGVARPRAMGDGQASPVDKNAAATPDPFVFYLPPKPTDQGQKAAAEPSASDTSPDDHPVSLGEPKRTVLQPDILGTRQLSAVSKHMSPDELYPFDEFATFLDCIGMPAEWAPAGLEIASDSIVDDGGRHIVNHQESALAAEDTARDGSPFHAWLPSVPPNAESIHGFDEITSYAPKDKSSPFRVEEQQRTRIKAMLEDHHGAIPGFSLPSRHTLSRYLVAFFQGFHMHMLFLHIPTFRLTDHSPEMILAMMAAGAQYRFEYQNAAKFFKASKAVVTQKLQAYNLQSPEDCVPGPFPTPGEPETRAVDEIMTIRSLLILMGFATWQEPGMLQEAFHLRNLLIAVLRRSGLKETTEALPIDSSSWAKWIELESSRRSKLAAFAFVDIYGIAYNNYPPIRNHEVKLRLPCQTKLWNAQTAAEWLAATRTAGQEQLVYHDALSQLLLGFSSGDVLSPMPSPLGNYYLLHGLIQRIHIIRELALDLGDQSTQLPEPELSRLERGLRAWTHMWQQAPESSMDPANENGPIPFTSSSMLGLAYVRLTLNLGPFRHLETGDPSRIAAALGRSPTIRRTSRMIPALIYAIHSFSIPVRLGIDYVARSQAFFWSVRHALASFECVVLLSKWLVAVAEAATANERRILRWVTLVVDEAYDSMDVAAENRDRVAGHTPGKLALDVLEIWARFFQLNSQWQFINKLGESLARYRALVESCLTHDSQQVCE